MKISLLINMKMQTIVSIFLFISRENFVCLCGDLMTHQPLWVILCCLPEKGRRDIGEIVEEMKERDREESKMNESEETEEIKHSSSTLTC